jgi:hypothetical protein
MRSQALMRSTSLPHAGDWLLVVPSETLGLKFKDWEFRPALQYWLGIAMYPTDSICPVCSSAADIYGDHHISCSGDGDRIWRHDAVRDALFVAAQSAALAPLREVPSLIPGTQSRPADIFLPRWTRGLPAALDVTIVSPLQSSLLRGAAMTSGFAAAHATERKRVKHEALCSREGISFFAVAAETTGGWDPRAAAIITDVARFQASRVGISPSESALHLFQRLSVTLWRSNSAMWIRRRQLLHPNVDGVL